MCAGAGIDELDVVDLLTSLLSTSRWSPPCSRTTARSATSCWRRSAPPGRPASTQQATPRRGRTCWSGATRRPLADRERGPGRRAELANRADRRPGRPLPDRPLGGRWATTSGWMPCTNAARRVPCDGRALGVAYVSGGSCPCGSTTTCTPRNWPPPRATSSAAIGADFGLADVLEGRALVLVRAGEPRGAIPFAAESLELFVRSGTCRTGDDAATSVVDPASRSWASRTC